MSIDEAGEIHRPWLNMREAALYLGVGTNSIRELWKQGEISRCFVLGSKRSGRFHTDDLDNYMRRAARR